MQVEAQQMGAATDKEAGAAKRFSYKATVNRPNQVAPQARVPETAGTAGGAQPCFEKHASLDRFFASFLF